LKSFLAVDLELVVVAVVTVLEWVEVVVGMPPRCSMLTVDTLPLVLLNILSVLDLLVDALAVVVAMVELVVVSMVVLPLYWVVDLAPSACKVDLMLVKDVLSLAIPVQKLPKEQTALMLVLLLGLMLELNLIPRTLRMNFISVDSLAEN